MQSDHESPSDLKDEECEEQTFLRIEEIGKIELKISFFLMLIDQNSTHT